MVSIIMSKHDLLYIYCCVRLLLRNYYIKNNFITIFIHKNDRLPLHGGCGENRI